MKRTSLLQWLFRRRRACRRARGSSWWWWRTGIRWCPSSKTVFMTATFPALAMDNHPAPKCFSLKFSSANFSP